MKKQLTRSVAFALSFILVVFAMFVSVPVRSLAVNNVTNYSDSYSSGEGPQITVQPSDVSAGVGQTAKITVKATGDGLSYQWQYKTTTSAKWKDSGMSGSTTATVSIPVTEARDGQQYRCVISDSNGNKVTSDVATLTVDSTAPIITSQPEDTSVLNGQTAQFSVSATGSNLSYQWQFRASSSTTWKNSGMTGSNTATIKIPATGARNGQQYRCIVTDSSGNSVISKAATLTVLENLAITTQPKNATVSVGDTAQFTVRATGNGLSYQWQFRAPSSSTWKSSGMTGSNTATIKIPATEARNGQQYRCVVTDSNGNSKVSNAATLTVEASELAIITQPTNQTGKVGDTVTFSVVAKGSGLSYQWQFKAASSATWKDSGMTGSKTAAISVPVTAARNGQKYRCVIVDSNDETVITKIATLTVK